MVLEQLCQFFGTGTELLVENLIDVGIQIGGCHPDKAQAGLDFSLYQNRQRDGAELLLGIGWQRFYAGVSNAITTFSNLTQHTFDIDAILCQPALFATLLAQSSKYGGAQAVIAESWLTILRHNMQSHAKNLEGVNVQLEDAQGDIGRQQAQIENFVAAGVDGIVVMLVDADSGKAISQIAEDAGIPLVFVTQLPAGIDKFPANQAWVGSDDYQAGKLETTEICKQLGGKGNAVILMGQLGTTGQRLRTQATHDVLASDACNGIEVIDEQSADFMRTPATNLMTNWFSAGIEPKAVISNNDEMALGAVQALKSAGISMDDVVIGGVDGTKDGLSALEAGDLDVTVFQNAKGQAVDAIDTVLKIARSDEFEPKNFIPFELVTSQNLAQYKTE